VRGMIIIKNEGVVEGVMTGFVLLVVAWIVMLGITFYVIHKK
jgi:hypothetical protein